MVTYEETTWTRTWENGNIHANNVSRTFYDSKCEKLFYRIFSIDDDKTSYIVHRCEEDIREQNKATEKQKKIEKLKDF